MVKRIIVASAILVWGGTGCMHKPEGPAERIGRSIDEISSALHDMNRDDPAQEERIRRERERRERENELRRERFDRYDDSSDEFGGGGALPESGVDNFDMGSPDEFGANP